MDRPLRPVKEVMMGVVTSFFAHKRWLKYLSIYVSILVGVTALKADSLQLSMITNATNLDFTVQMFAESISTIRQCLLNTGNQAYEAQYVPAANVLLFRQPTAASYAGGRRNGPGYYASLSASNNTLYNVSSSNNVYMPALSGGVQTAVLHGGAPQGKGAASMSTADQDGGYFFILIGTENGITYCETYFNASYMTDTAGSASIWKEFTDSMVHYWVNPYGWGQQYIAGEVAGVELGGSSFTVTLIPRSTSTPQVWDAIAYIDSYGNNYPMWQFGSVQAINSPAPMFPCYFKYPSEDEAFMKCYTQLTFSV